MSVAYFPSQKDGNDQSLLLVKHMEMAAVTGFRAPLVIGDQLARFSTVRQTASGVSDQFELFGWDDSTHEYESGEEIVGDPFTYDAANITLDKRLIKPFELGQTQQEIWHRKDTLSSLVMGANRSMSEHRERRIHTMLVSSARSSSLTKDSISIHTGGSNIARTGGDQETVYPVTVTGAKRLRDDIYQAAKEMDEAGIPSDSRTMLLTPHLRNVLFQDTTLFNKDLTNAGHDLVKRSIGEIAGFALLPTTWLPSTLITAVSTIKDPSSKYQGDFRYNGATGRPVALFVYTGMDAERPIGTKVMYPYSSKMWFDDNRDVWKFASRLREGHGVLNPECIKELRVSA